MSPRLTAALLILAAVLATLAFTALGSIFDYPDVLDEPAGDVLASFRDHEGAVSAWFGVLALSAGAVRARSRSASGGSPPRARCASRCGWGSPRRSCRSSGCSAGRSSCPGTPPTPGARRRASPRPAATRSRPPSDILGTAIGETLGYLLTATWTALVLVALGRAFAGRWFGRLGGAAAALVLIGVLSPLDLPVVDTRELRRLHPLERLADRVRCRAVRARAARRRAPAAAGGATVAR